MYFKLNHSGIDEENTRFKVNDSVAKAEAYLKKLYRMKDEIYLHLLADDKKFVDSLLERPGLLSANKKHSEELHRLVKFCQIRSAGRQEILRLRRPLYFFRFMKKAMPSAHKMKLKSQREIKKNNIIMYADFLLTTLNDLRKQRDYARFFRSELRFT